MEKSHPINSPMVVRSLEMNKDPFRPKEENEESLGLKVPYLSAIGALMYFANCIRPDIAFSVNLLARYSSAPTKRHWNGVKHILRYLRGTSDMDLYYSKESKSQLGMQMQDIFQILIKLDLKRDMSLLMVERQYLGDQSSKQW